MFFFWLGKAIEEIATCIEPPKMVEVVPGEWDFEVSDLNGYAHFPVENGVLFSWFDRDWDKHPWTFYKTLEEAWDAY